MTAAQDPATTTPPATTAANIETILNNIVAITNLATKADVETAIIGFLTALPGIIALVQDFQGWIKTVSGDNPQAFISELGTAFSQLKIAQTDAQKQAAAAAIAAAIARIKKGK